jgi:indolepyruvate ferredoxin oxidoreductase beta subunit
MNEFNIYMTGAGGQGIGLLSEILLRAADHAGHTVKGVDTHGLAQRGGIVVSSLRLGDKIYSPLISEGEADMVIGLERHEALRGMNGYLKDGGILVYYNTVWQPLETRLDIAEEVSEEIIHQQCLERNIREIRVFNADLKDIRMQNIVVLGHIDKYELIPEVKTDHYKQAMADLMSDSMLKKNMNLFDQERMHTPHLS